METRNRAKIMNQLAGLWAQHPHLRFWQVIELLRKPGEDPYYLTDDETSTRLSQATWQGKDNVVVVR